MREFHSAITTKSKPSQTQHSMWDYSSLRHRSLIHRGHQWLVLLRRHQWPLSEWFIYSSMTHDYAHFYHQSCCLGWHHKSVAQSWSYGQRRTTKLHHVTRDCILCSLTRVPGHDCFSVKQLSVLSGSHGNIISRQASFQESQSSIHIYTVALQGFKIE